MTFFLHLKGLEKVTKKKATAKQKKNKIKIKSKNRSVRQFCTKFRLGPDEITRRSSPCEFIIFNELDGDVQLHVDKL